MKQVLVTGATGFIGFHLVELLTQQSVGVTCLIRSRSRASKIEDLGADLVRGDVTDLNIVDRLKGRRFDAVFHLAGLTKSLRSQDLFDTNVEGCRNIAAVCAAMSPSPRLILVSSLAAAGPDPADGSRDHLRSYPTVSAYGASKRAGEVAALEFSDRVPITIMRPPIVLGQGDRDGLTMYQLIQRYRIHLVPCIRDKRYSVIHASELARACLLAAESGLPVDPELKSGQGFYYPCAEEIYTYAGLGRAIAKALGRPVLNVRVPSPLVWVIAGISQLVGRLRGKPSLLNLDKAREATSVSWTCDHTRLMTDTGFAPAKTFSEYLEETVAWYREHGWL